MSLKILGFRQHPSFNSKPQPDNPIVMKEHECSDCGKKWKEPIHKYGGTYAYCEECCKSCMVRKLGGGAR